MGETGKEEYKIQSFDSETQKLLKTALKGQQVFMNSSATHGFGTIGLVLGPAQTLVAFQVPQSNQGPKRAGS